MRTRSKLRMLKNQKSGKRQYHNQGIKDYLANEKTKSTFALGKTNAFEPVGQSNPTLTVHEQINEETN